MPKSKFNHSRKILGKQPIKVNGLIPGMILEFKYSKPDITDKNPLILFLYYDFKNGVVDGLNLNYLSDYRFKKLFNGFKRRTDVSTIGEEASNLISEDFTFVLIPPYKKLQTRSKSEIIVEMKRMYKEFISPRYGFQDIYRSYSIDNIKSLKAINFKDY